MILDAETRFSNKQDLTGSGAVASENIVKLHEERRIGTGYNLYVYVLVTTALVGGGGTVQVELQADDNEAFSSPTNIQDIGTFAAAAPAGSELEARIAPEILTESFVRLNYTRGAALSAGAVSAFIVEGIQAFTAYKSGFTVS